MTRLVLLISLSALTHGPAASSAEPDPALELRQLFAAEWEHEMEQNPTWASQLGDRRWNDRWEDLSLENIARQHEHRKGVLARLAKIPRDRLGAKDRLNYDLFGKQYQTAVDEFPFQWYLLPLNHREGIQTTDDLADALRFESLKDYEDWIARLRVFPTYSQQTIALLRRGLEAGMRLPRVVMQRLPAQIDKQLVEMATNSPFYRPFRSFPAAIVEADRARLSEQARTAITRAVLPSFRDLKRFVTETYLPACPEEVGIWKLPRGEEMYRFFARKYTTTDYEPRRIHELGLAEVKRIREQMENIKRQTGFSGELVDFFQWLRTDPRFYFRSGDELLAAYRAMGKRIDPLMVKIFHTLPRMPYGIEPIPDNIAPDTTTAYYRQPAADGSRAGTYFVNLYKPETRPKYEMMALSLHEAIPGHHHQIALAMELGEMPNFRRYGGYTAFIEGWGLYAESLGEDLKLYDDPYAKFGQLTYEMWRAVRLVVDTGMHTFKWPRQRAIDYFLANAAKSELDVVNEIDRYIAWPGQALAYKIGELKLQELRNLSRQELGEKFDLKKFHDAVLLAGAVPLDILEQNIKDWMRKP